MTQMKIYDQAGAEKGMVDLPEKIFGLKEKRDVLVHELVVSMMMNKRNVVAGTKTRGEVRGGGKKPWQQKGTGRARVGSIRSPLWRGGGVIFGPKPRKYGYNLPKKVRQLAVAGGPSDKRAGNKIKVLEGVEIKAGKTKEMAKLLKLLSLKGKVLLLIDDENQVLVRRAG